MVFEEFHVFRLQSRVMARLSLDALLVEAVTVVDLLLQQRLPLLLELSNPLGLREAIV